MTHQPLPTRPPLPPTRREKVGFVLCAAIFAAVFVIAINIGGC